MPYLKIIKPKSPDQLAILMHERRLENCLDHGTTM